MERWRDLLSRLGLAQETSAENLTRERTRPDPVEPSEIALILLKNAMRLLDQATVPAEVKTYLRSAIIELEEYIAQRSEASGPD